MTITRKTVSIRGLDTQLYHNLFSVAKSSGRKVSELVNEAFRLYLASINRSPEYHDGAVELPKITNDGFISLSKKDILGLRKEIGNFGIETSGRLVFEKDVDRTALECIQSIDILDGSVEVPRDIYPLMLIKSKIQGRLEKY